MIEGEALVSILGLVGMVVIGGALLAGPTERSGLPALAVFLLLGVLIGPFGLNLFTVELDDPILRVVATLSLTLVLFTDAMTLDLQEVRRNKLLAALVLGPGTLLAALGFAAAAWALLGLHPVAALVVGAALASTDPVILRSMLQGSGLSDRLRLALRLESGMNDVLLLPIVVIALAFGLHGAPTNEELVRLLISLFVFGPLAGVAVGLSAVRLLVWVRERFGVRREYEALYVIGVALGAYAGAEALGGSGFLAAFAAGLVVSSLDVELCDCFLEYGQVTAEMALLFTYVLLGTAPIWSGLSMISPLSLLFALVILLLRLPIFAIALRPLKLALSDRLTLGWYAPRGLGSLLLALLAVFDGLPGGEQLVALTSLGVLVSLVFQGGWPLIHRRPRRSRPIAQPSDTSNTIPLAAQTQQTDRSIDEHDMRITIEEMQQIPPEAPAVLIDARSERSYLASDQIAVEALRVSPDRAVADLKAHGVPTNAWVIAYCT